jgi:two-component system, sensor histidine kinase RpfC
VATTAHDGSDVIKRCREAGLKDCLTKPLDLDSMVQMVEKWVHPEGILEPKESVAPVAPAAEAVPAPEAATAAGAPAPSPPTAPAPLAQVLPIHPASEPAEDSGEPVLDENRLKSSSMGNQELEGILIRTFVHHIRPRLQRLREAAAAGDAGAIEFEAHGIKGMCSTIGAMACADVFGRIERLGREKRLEPVTPMLDYADMEVSRVETLVGPRAKAA